MSTATFIKSTERPNLRDVGTKEERPMLGRLESPSMVKEFAASCTGVGSDKGKEWKDAKEQDRPGNSARTIVSFFNN
jgi:hypothetical protein